MMATEATSDDLATPVITLDRELNTTESQDAVPEESLVKGSGSGSEEKDEPKPDTEHVETSVNSAEVSVSGGSDTEASKLDTKNTGDAKGHARTTSTVKKASFKPVSVNKTFLAAKGATAVPASKLGEKSAPGAATAQTGPSATAAPRPRLVAKLGSGLRDSAPRASTGANGGKPGAAPDASAVWNKNRPVPAPEPKRFTDEELKQRYGIHLATRLQSDDPGKQANWADIDDDDDDWAPETIEWTDGTKITLPQADEAPSPAPERAPTPALKDTKPIEKITPSVPVATAQSPSTAAKPSVFGGRTGLVLKGASEKPTLVAKPPGPPTPVKSPWAPLPPIDKATPIAIDITQNQQPSQSRFAQRDPHGFHTMPPPPAKEIAADDFSRSWREGNSNASRELYNSQSGRYEPVNDNRRGSVRNDAHSRQPALLQRPSHQDGPAEPSAAFQTHRAGGQDPTYGRRRTSSNVSGGSGNPNLVRRMSRGHDMPPPHESLNARRGSLAAVSDAPSSPRNFSPSGQPPIQRGYSNTSWQARASPVVNHQSPQSAHSQMVLPTEGQGQSVSAAVEEDPIEIQKEVMRRKRELAIKRRQEEEEKEEAARKERIRIKLEAMGPPPESKKKKEAQKEEKPAPTQIQTRETASAPSQPTNPVVVEDSVTSNIKSTMPADDKVDKVEAPNAPSVEKSAADQENRPNGVNHGSGVPPSAGQAAQENKSSKPWPNNQAATADRFNGWAGPPAQPVPPRNVWGPPTNDRSLGNGTFNPELSRVPDVHQSSNPGPIGPPNRGNAQNQQGRGRELYGSRPGPIGPPNRQSGPLKAELQRNAVANSGWGSLPERLAQEDAQQFQQQEAEIAKRRELQEAGLAQDVPQPVFKDTWRQVTLNDDGSRSKIQAVSTAVLDPTAKANSTWKTYPEKAPEDGASRATFDDNDNSHRRQLENMGSAPQQQFNEAWRSASGMNASPPVRGSRFFPSNRDIRLEEGNIPFERPGSPSPPPPTMAGHPAYDGDSAHPHVALPPPMPVVKLPPTVLAPIGPPKPVSFAAAVSTPSPQPTQNSSGYAGRQEQSGRQTSSYQDTRRFPEPAAGGWQDRINSLIGRKHSPPKSHVLAVDSSSKNALELPPSPLAATVSLPSSVSGDLSIDDNSVFSKPASEECFEEQEMGSLPIIKCPAQAPANAWRPAPDPKSIPRKFIITEVTTVEPLLFSQHVTKDGGAINILLPGQEETKSVNIPIERKDKNSPRRGNVRGGAPRQPSRGASHPRGRGRDASSGFQSPRLDTAALPSSSPVSSSRGGHRGGRGYGANWNRHVSTPVHT